MLKMFLRKGLSKKFISYPLITTYKKLTLVSKNQRIPLKFSNVCCANGIHREKGKLFSTSANSCSETKALTIFSQISKVKSSPVPALALGLAGLIPFMAAPGYMVFQQSYSAQISFAQLAYGTSILSFLGGVRWGLSLHEDGKVKPDWMNLGYSVTPSLVAWLALLLPEPVSQGAVIAGLGGAAYIDTTWHGYPDWFKALRYILSFFAILSLWSTVMCKYLIKERKK